MRLDFHKPNSLISVDANEGIGLYYVIVNVGVTPSNCRLIPFSTPPPRHSEVTSAHQ